MADSAFNGAMTMHGKSKFGGQANKSTGEAGRASVDGGRFNHLAASDVKDRFIARLKIGIPLALYEVQSRSKQRKKRYVELYTDNDARTLKVEPLTEDKYQIAVRQSKRYDSADPATLVTAAVERAKTRAAEKSKVDYSKVGRLADKAYELRTVDIKDLWQADVEYGDLEKHTILDWADGTALDLEGSDLDETLFVHKGLALCLDDWTKNTSEYSDFWDSL